MSSRATHHLHAGSTREPGQPRPGELLQAAGGDREGGPPRLEHEADLRDGQPQEQRAVLLSGAGGQECAPRDPDQRAGGQQAQRFLHREPSVDQGQHRPHLL